MTAAVAIDTDPLDRAARIAEHMLGEAVASLVRIGGGRNSQVYRLDLSGERRAVLKCYFQNVHDERDRRHTEALALRFLHEHGVSCVPRLLETSVEHQASLLEFIAGTPVSAAEATRLDLEQLASFLVTLHRLASEPEAALLPIASEAVFSLEDILASITRRLQRLTRVATNTLPSPGTPGEGGKKTSRQRELAEFLDCEFVPALDRTSTWAAAQLEPLPMAARTLSPSDFGFHNTLRLKTGDLAILDFEYFGQDDPAKTMSDFLLHPGMPLSVEQRGWFLQHYLAGLGCQHGLPERLRVAYVLYALKWVMIVLNEFVPEILARRLFANPALRADEVQGVQLTKARDMLARSVSGIHRFPYEEWIRS